MSVTIKDIEAVLDERVRPVLADHQGNVIIQSFEDQILKVRLTGKCSGCPAAHSTNEELIRAEVQDAFPSVQDVILVQEVSSELMDMARKILNHQL